MSSEADRLAASLQKLVDRLDVLLEIHPPPFEGRGWQIGEMQARLVTAIDDIRENPKPEALSKARRTLFALASDVVDMERRHGLPTSSSEQEPKG
jgi:hypothetical protein